MNPRFLECVKRLPTDWVADLDAFDAIKVEHDTERVISAGHPDVHNLAPYSAFTSFEVGRRAAILEFDQLPEKIPRLNGLADVAPEVVFLSLIHI